jgi:hypothetical protein
MIKDIIVVDDVFSDVDKIVDIAKSMTYYSLEDHPDEKAYWSGLRTRSVSSLDKLLWKDISSQIIFKSLATTMGQNKTFIVDVSWDATLYFHQLMESDVYQESWKHIDPKLVYAGVVYLNKNPKPNSGTFIIKDDKTRVDVENKFNRLVLYRSDYFHSSMGGFGQTLDDSRLTLTLFFKQIYFSLTHPEKDN